MLEKFYETLCPAGQFLSYTTGKTGRDGDLHYGSIKNTAVTPAELVALLEQDQGRLNGFITLGGVPDHGPYVRDPKKNVTLRDAQVKSFVFDLDIIKEGDTDTKNKYASSDALKRALAAALAERTIAPPTDIVSSGSGGLHLWYLLDQTLPLLKWQEIRKQIAKAMVARGFLFDTGVATQAHSLIRAPGSMNLKPRVMSQCRLHPRREPYDLKDLLSTWELDRSGTQSTSISAKRASKPTTDQSSEASLDGTLTVPSYLQGVESSAAGAAQGDLEPLGIYPIQALTGCRFSTHVLKHGTDSLNYDQYLALASIARRIENGSAILHEASKNHPRYDPAATDQMLSENGIGTDAPISCLSLVSTNGTLCDGSSIRNSPHCQSCPVSSKASEGKAYPVIQIHRMAELLRSREETKTFEQTVMQRAPLGSTCTRGTSSHTAQEAITGTSTSGPSSSGLIMPKGFRINRGTLLREVYNPKDDAMTDVTVADRMFWIGQRRLSEDGASSYLLSTRYSLDAALAPPQSLNDVKRLCDSLSDAQVAVKDRKHIVDYFQECAAMEIDTVQTHQQMGWKTNRHFVNYDEQWDKAGTIQDTICDPDQQQFLAEHAGSEGTLEEWRSAIEPAFSPSADPIMMFSIFYALGSVLVHPCGLRGNVAVAALYSPDSGTGKTTCLKIATSLFGQSNQGHNGFADTDLSMRSRLGFLNHLPACMDELTTLDSDRLREFIYAAVQGAGKQARKQDGTARPAQDWANTLLATTNESFWSSLQSHKKAIIDRVFEYYIDKPILDSTAADDMMEGLVLNYGVAGPAFVDHLQAMPVRKIKGTFDRFKAALKAPTYTNDDRFTLNAMSISLTAMALCGEIPEMKITSDHTLRLAKWIKSQGTSAADKRANVARDGILHPSDLMAYVALGVRDTKGQPENMGADMMSPNDWVWKGKDKEGDEHLYVRRPTVSKWLRESNSPVSWNSILSDWVHRGYCKAGTIRIRVQDQSGNYSQPTVFAIKLECLS